MAYRRQKELLKNRQFLILWFEQLLTQFSYNLLNFSLIIAVFKLTRSNFSVGILLLCFYLPSAITALFAGFFSDHFPRKKIMIYSNLIWAALVLGFIIAKGSFAQILILTILIQITDEFFSNANSATIPSVVQEKDLMMANSFFSFTNYGCMLLGSISVGFLVRFFSIDSPFFLASFLVTLGAFFVSRLSFEQKISKMPKNKEVVEHVIDQIIKGWRFIRSNRVVSLLVALNASLSGLLGLVLAISPGYVEGVLGIEAADASFIFVLPLGVGLIIAGFVLGKLGKKYRKIEFIQRGLMVIGFCLLLLALIPKSRKLTVLTTQKKLNFESHLGISLPLTLIVTFLGLGGALVFVPTSTLFQESIPENLRGRVISTSTLLTYFFSSVLTFSSGFIADQIGFFPILTFLAISGVFLGFFSRKILIEARVLEK